MTNEDFQKLVCKYEALYSALSKLDQELFWVKDARNFEEKQRALVQVNDTLQGMVKILLEARVIVELDPLYPIFSDEAPVAVTS